MCSQRSIWAFLAFVLTATATQAQPPEKDDGKHFFFKDGDTIVVMGDSITEQHLYSNYLEMWSVCRFPKRNLTFRNVGIGGDRSTGGNSRFKRDVLAHKATVLTVDFGMNDGGYKAFDQKTFDTYMNGLQGIADQAKAAKIRVAWITPQPLEKKEPGALLTGYNETLERFSEGVEQIAIKNSGIFVDQFHPYLAVMTKARASDPQSTYIMGGDPVHPGPTGQIVMAASILKRLDFQRLIANVEIDLDPKPATKAMKKPKDKAKPSEDKTDLPKEKTGPTIEPENCKVGAFKAPTRTSQGDGSISFTCLPSGLPFFPPEKEAKAILKWSPILEDMNRYWLTVKGLKPGNYEVQIDNQKIAEYTAEQLAGRVNLAEKVLAAGPIADQVQQVWKAVTDKNRYFHDQVFRGVVLKANNPELYAERMKKMPELDAAVRQALEMKPHTVSIVPLAK
jgi:lysophospholipase L1-like esterase